MNRFRVSVAGSVLFLVVTVTCVLMTSHKSVAGNPGGGPDVNIAGPLPLPVTGTLNVADGSAVSINNPASSPVLVRDVDRGTPFQMSSFHASSKTVTFGPVPLGQRWIIEHVSGYEFGPTSVTDGFLQTAGHTPDFMIAQKTDTNGFQINNQTKFIVDPGESVTVGFDSLSGPQFNTSAFISGVVVPAP